MYKAHTDGYKTNYDSLLRVPMTDHVHVFKKIFESTPIASFLEFGLGYATKYFLDHCDEVTSVEVLIPRLPEVQEFLPLGHDEIWYEKFMELYEGYPNWRPSLYTATEVLAREEMVARKTLPRTRDNGAYFEEIQTLVKETLAQKHFDLAFVDPGMFLRGEFVQALFGGVDLIVTHDTTISSYTIGNRTLQYSWDKVKTPPEYAILEFPDGSGTTVWVKQEKQDLIEKLTWRGGHLKSRPRQ